MTLRSTADTARGDWIRPRLGNWLTISGVMPQGFEAYARVFHSVGAQQLEWHGDDVRTTHEETLRWRDVAQRLGRTAHPLMQWSSIAGSHRNPSRGRDGWQLGTPRTGELTVGELAAIAAILSRHMDAGAACTAGLWEGYGWIQGGSAVAAMFTTSTDPNEIAEAVRQSRRLTPPAFPAETMSAARLELPGRAYLLFSCELRDFTDPQWQERSGWDRDSSPNQLWPDDTSWYLASEIDFDSTLIGGSRALVDELVGCPALEIAEIPADASLQFDADTVNRPSAR